MGHMNLKRIKDKDGASLYINLDKIVFVGVKEDAENTASGFCTVIKFDDGTHTTVDGELDSVVWSLLS